MTDDQIHDLLMTLSGIDISDTNLRDHPAAYAAVEAALAASQPANAPSHPHQDDVAVDMFAKAMKEKLAAARAKGRSGWQSCHEEDLSRMLREHVEKGDPRDVANFCMFLWNLGGAIKSVDASQPAPVALKDHEVREIVSAVTKVAHQYGQTQQLRERIKDVLFPVLKRVPAPVEAQAVPPGSPDWSAIGFAAPTPSKGEA